MASPDMPSQPTAPRQGRRRTVVLALMLTMLALVATSAGVGAQAYGHQQSALTAAQAERGAALRSLDLAVRNARSDGLTPEQLAGVVVARKGVLSETPMPARLGLFDGGETRHAREQAGRLRALLSKVHGAEVTATSSAAAAAGRTVESFAGAIADEQSAGLDATADLAALQASRAALAAATSPNGVRAAVSGLDDRAGAAHNAADRKRAADAVAAAEREQAKLDSSRGDARSALARGDRLLNEAQLHAQLQVGAAATSIAAAHAAFDVAKLPADFDAVTGTAGGAADSIGSLLAARSGAYSAMDRARAAVRQAQGAGIDSGAIPAGLDGFQPQLDGAGTRQAFEALSAQITGLVQPLLNRLGVAQVGPGKVIVISLANQSLTAYQDGLSFLTTAVTTGRPALPTPPGSYSVVRRNNPWTMTSDWPRDSPYWYPPSQVQYVLWFTNSGYGIHDAPWRGYYGPGTQAHGSHGCVNVPMPTMASLYSWADLGTRVIVN